MIGECSVIVKAGKGTGPECTTTCSFFFENSSPPIKIRRNQLDRHSSVTEQELSVNVTLLKLTTNKCNYKMWYDGCRMGNSVKNV